MLRRKFDSMPDPFLAGEPAIDGAVFARKRPNLVDRVTSDLERMVVALRCREGREVSGLCLDGVFLSCISKCAPVE